LSRKLARSPSSTASARPHWHWRALGLCRRSDIATSQARFVGLVTLVLAVTATSHAGAAVPLAFDALDRRRDAPSNEEPYYRSDGVYGRFDGELALVPAVGMQWTASGWFTQLGMSAFYLNTIGIAFRHADGRWSPISPRADFSVTTLSLALRPLFLLRWSQDLEKGPSFLDLMIDSLTLHVGSYWSHQHSVDKQRYGLETELAFGFPILGRAHGPWLTASAANRWPKVTNAGNGVDMAFGLRFEWSFSLGN
jgi:hypothetical protein